MLLPLVADTSEFEKLLGKRTLPRILSYLRTKAAHEEPCNLEKETISTGSCKAYEANRLPSSSVYEQADQQCALSVEQGLYPEARYGFSRMRYTGLKKGNMGSSSLLSPST